MLGFCFLTLSVLAQKADKKEEETKKEKTYADLIKDMKVDEGIFTLYQNEDKVYFEIPEIPLKRICFGLHALWHLRKISVLFWALAGK